jgi:hypothetical protein
MQEDTLAHDATIQRLVHEFDDLAGRLHTLIEGHDSHGAPHTALWQAEMEFTTEWQMVATAEEAPSD